jgi:hypothetical protein
VGLGVFAGLVERLLGIGVAKLYGYLVVAALSLPAPAITVAAVAIPAGDRREGSTGAQVGQWVGLAIDRRALQLPPSIDGRLCPPPINSDNRVGA